MDQPAMRMRSPPPSRPHAPHQEGKRAVGLQRSAHVGHCWPEAPEVRPGVRARFRETLRSERESAHTQLQSRSSAQPAPTECHKNPGGYETGKTPHAHPEGSLRGRACAVRGALLCAPRTAGLP